MSTALIILAAGASARMGRAKQLLPYRGTTLLGHAADTALASRCQPIIVVVGSQADEMRIALADRPLQIVNNLDWPKGMGTSMRAGINVISSISHVSSSIIMLCDQPQITSAHLDALIDSHICMTSYIVASSYGDIAGVPALFDRTLFGDLLRLEDTSGARQLIHRHSHLVSRVPFEGALIDVDVPADYERLL